VAIDLATVRHIAKLANLEFTEEELQVFSRQLNSILVYIDKLDELDTGAIEPTSHVTETSHAFREDRVVPSLPVAEALRNAPESGDGHFKVPKVIG
jgi:aspartyl-tRNA(Asn)/glutamyl-tRNA(Gln) amidotransferase subunit C